MYYTFHTNLQGKISSNMRHKNNSPLFSGPSLILLCFTFLRSFLITPERLSAVSRSIIKSANLLRASADKTISTGLGAGARTRATALFLLGIINSRFNALQHHRYRLISVKGICAFDYMHKVGQIWLSSHCPSCIYCIRRSLMLFIGLPWCY